MNQCLDLVLVASPTTTFVLLLIFGPYILNFLVKFVSPSSSMTRISPGQHPNNAGASCLILWTLISLHKCTLKSSGYSPFEILYRRPPPVIEKLKGDHQQLAGDVPTPPGPGKSLLLYRLINLRKDTHSFGQLGSSLSAMR